MRRLTKHDFSKLLHKTYSIIQTWGLRHLSLAGKITLLDASYMSLPMFLLTHSHIPRSTLDEIEKRARSFLWDSDPGRRGMHYISWDVVCKPKALGGLGLHASRKWEGPLKARLAWDFINGTDKFPYNIISEVYGCNPWVNPRSRTPSTAWKTITMGALCLQHILRWDINSGCKAHLLDSAWILDLPLAKWPTFLNMDIIEEVCLSDLVDEGGWIVGNLRVLFGPDLVSLILLVQNPIPTLPDLPQITPMMSGATVSSLAYRKLFSECCPVDLPVSKLKLSPKEKMFWWRLCHDALPTGEWLSRRHISSSNTCPWGCDEVDDRFHISMGCKAVRAVLDQLGRWGIRIPQFHSLDDILDGLRHLPRSLRTLGQIYCATIHKCWFARVNHKHNRTFLSPLAIASSVLSSLTHMASSPIPEQWGTTQSSGLSPSTWYPPPPGWLKINVDGSLATNHLAGLGVVIRKADGSLVKAAGKQYIHWDSFQVERDAVMFVSSLLEPWMFDMEGVMLEGDNTSVMQAFQRCLDGGRRRRSSDPNLVVDFLLDFKQVLFLAVDRECNKAADFCARQASSGFSFVWLGVDAHPSFLSLLKDELDFSCARRA